MTVEQMDTTRREPASLQPAAMDAKKVGGPERS
jgi:hypothetical protein